MQESSESQECQECQECSNCSNWTTEQLIQSTRIYCQRSHKKQKLFQHPYPSSFLYITSHNLYKTNEICPLDQIEDKNKIQEIEFIDINHFKLPTNLSQFVSLTGLSLHFLNLTIVPDEICKLTNLLKLSLSFNKLTDLSSTLNQLSALRNLKLSHNQLENVPSVVFELTNLQILKLQNNHLRSIDHRITRLFQLKKLSLFDNDFLEKIPYRLFKRDEFSSELQGIVFGRSVEKTEYTVNSLFHLAATAFIQRISKRFPIKKDNLQVQTLRKSFLPNFIKEILSSSDYWFCDKCNWIQFGTIFVSVFRSFHGTKILTKCSVDLTKSPCMVYNFCSTYCLSEWLWKNLKSI